MFQEQSRKYKNYGDAVINKKEMEEREKRWKQQQKVREEFMEADLGRREKRWEQMLKQRDEEWKEEIVMRERELMHRLDSRIKTFYNE